MPSESTSSGPGRRAVVYLYTQTGQLRDVADALTAPLVDHGWQVRWVPVRPSVAFPFPWPIRAFFGVFPDAVDPDASVDLVEPIQGFASEPGELVVLASQVWFLAPSVPVRSLLTAHPEAVRDRDVVCLLACRNMWYSAAVELSRLLADMGARRSRVIAATDTRSSLTSLVTTLRWLLTGRREPFLWFGPAGVGSDELTRIAEAGRRLAQGQSLPDDAAPVAPALAAADLLAGSIFRSWGRAIRSARRVGPAATAVSLTGFVVALAVGIAVGLPVITIAASAGGPRFAAAMEKLLTHRMSMDRWTGREAVGA